MSFISDGIFDVFMYFRIGNTAAPLSVLKVSLSDGTSQKISHEDLEPVEEGRVRVIAISDTHNRHECVKVPPCDILVHTGDILMTSRFRSKASSLKHYQAFCAWIAEQPAKEVIITGGNHDAPLENMTADELKSLFKAPHIHYLCNSHVDISGYRFIGTPLSKGSSGNNGFQSAAFKTATEEYFRSYRSTECTTGSSSSSRLVLCSHGTCESVVDVMSSDICLHLYGHYHARYGARWSSINDEGKHTAKVEGKPDNTPVPVPGNGKRFLSV